MAKFILLSEVRTGGTMLSEALAAHPQIRMLGEIFDVGPSDYWKKVRRPMVARLYPWESDVTPTSNLVPLLNLLLTEYDGFLLHRQDQIAADNPAWAYLASRTSLKIIHLYRENLFMQFFSERLALLTNVWHLEPGMERPKWPTFRIDPDECFNSMRERWAFFEWSRYLFQDHPAITIRYEDIDRHPSAIFAYCQGFLEVPMKELPVNYRKLFNGSPAEVVSNYEELKARFRGTEFERFLEDPSGS